MSELLIEDRGAVRILTMNRPDKRDAWAGRLRLLAAGDAP
jgi:hypothetical protein